MARILEAASTQRRYLVSYDLHGSTDDNDYKIINEILGKLFSEDEPVSTVWTVRTRKSRREMYDGIIEALKRKRISAKSITLLVVQIAGRVLAKKTKL